MGKLGTYKNKNVYDFPTLVAAVNASIDNDIFSVYWISGNYGKMLWKGEEIARIQSDSEGLHVVDFDEEVWRPKKKELSVPLPSGTKKEEAPKKKEESKFPTKEMELPLYDVNWYERVMGELNNQWLKIRPTLGVEN